MVQERDEIVGLDAGILMAPQVWVTSGHVAEFSDPMVECLNDHRRYRLDELPGTEDLSPAELADPGDRGPPRAPVPRRRRTTVRAAQVQPDVPDVDGPGPGRRRGRLPATRDRAGHLRQLQERPRDVAQEDPVRHRPDRQGVPERDLARQLRVPDARVRADGDAVLRPSLDGRRSTSRRGASAEARGTRATASRPRACASGSIGPTNSPTTRRRPSTSSTASRSAGRSSRGSTTAATSISPAMPRRAGENLEYFDPTSEEHYIPWVVETSAGGDRGAFTFLIDAYREEEVRGETRVVLGFHPELAPYKVAVLPLLKKRPEIVELAHRIKDDLIRHVMAVYDDTASIGKLYRRQDEIGTPWCITVDVDSLDDQAVTIRERDSMTQERVSADRIVDLIRDRCRRGGLSRAGEQRRASCRSRRQRAGSDRRRRDPVADPAAVAPRPALVDRPGRASAWRRSSARPLFGVPRLAGVLDGGPPRRLRPTSCSADATFAWQRAHGLSLAIFPYPPAAGLPVLAVRLLGLDVSVLAAHGGMLALRRRRGLDRRPGLRLAPAGRGPRDAGLGAVDRCDRHRPEHPVRAAARDARDRRPRAWSRPASPAAGSRRSSTSRRSGAARRAVRVAPAMAVPGDGRRRGADRLPGWDPGRRRRSLWPSRWLDNLAAGWPTTRSERRQGRQRDRALARFPVPGWLPYLAGLAVVVVAIPRLMRAPIGEAAAGALLVGVAVSPHAWGYEAALIAPFIWWAIAGGIAEPWRTRSAIAAYVLAPFWLVSGWTQLSTVAIVVWAHTSYGSAGCGAATNSWPRSPAYEPPGEPHVTVTAKLQRPARSRDGLASWSTRGPRCDRRRRRPSRDPSSSRPRARTTPRDPPIAGEGIGRHRRRLEARRRTRGAYSEGG